MASQLQEPLRSLCNNTAWCYAVFWKLHQKVLEWEDGFCKKPGSKELFFPSFSATSWPSYLLDDCIEMVVEKMSCQSYPIGDGIVGQVACTDMHRWISNPRDKELPTGWHEQFAAGIKTITLIGVYQGVVQLGSTEVASEDLNLVGHVKALFSGVLQSPERLMETLDVVKSQREKTTVNDPITRRMPDMSDLWSSLVARGRHMKGEQYLPSQLQCETSLRLQGDTLAFSPITSEQQAEHPSRSSQTCNELQQHTMQPATPLLDDRVSESIVHWPSSQQTADNRAAFEHVTAKFMEPALPINQNIDCSMLDVILPDMECWQSKIAGVAYKRPRYSIHAKSNVQIAQPMEAAFGILGIDTQQSVAMPCIGTTSKEHVQGVQVPDANSLSVSENNTFLIEARSFDECAPATGTSCANDSLLQDVHTFDLFNSHDIRELEFAHTQTQSSSIVPCAGFHVHHFSEREPSSNDVLQSFFSRELYEFDNFIASLQNKEEVQSNEVLSQHDDPGASETWNRSYGASFWDHGCFQHSHRSKLQGATGELKEDVSTSCQSTVENNVLEMGRLRETVENKFLHIDGYGGTPSIVSSVYSNTEHKTSHQGPQNRPETGLSTHAQGDLCRASGKKRTRQGESSRPRPKDRQLIQDRVHELRSIIPSSQKCSIDALLDKTIKYMRFLQTVTEEAGICNDQSRLQVGEGDDGSNMKEAGGSSWVMELGGNGRDCPLFVEDLKQPQHMLVEMLCEEKGLFLEIANTLKGLGLKILKGLMELRDEKMWARWVIKGNEQVHRVQIVWALMHLIESSTRAVSSVTDSTCG